MARAKTSLRKFYVCPDYSVEYRRNDRASWPAHTGGNYVLIACLTGSFIYLTGSSKGLLSAGELMLLEPNVLIEIRMTKAEIVLLNLSPSLLLPHAVAMRLIP